MRIQSAEGTKRLDADITETSCSLFEKVHDLFNLNSFAFTLYRQRNNKDEIRSSKSRTLQNIGLKHGDMLYLAPVNGTVLFPQASTSKSSNNNVSIILVVSKYFVQSDPDLF